MALGDGTAWDETSPASSDLISQGDDEIRDLRKGTRIRLAKEHDTPATSSAGGEHKAGSAKIYIQSSAPTTRPDGSTALTSADDGRIWFDADTSSRVAYVYDDSSTESNNWTPLGMVPVGSIIAWHKTFTNTPSLPANFLECNGQTVSDAESPYDGQVIPDLNDATNRSTSITSGGGVFLRGGDTSGTFTDDQIQHHDHDVFERATSATTGSGLTLVQDSSTPGSASNTPTSGVVDVKNSTNHTAAGDARVGNETAPFNMTVVWIIRIK